MAGSKIAVTLYLAGWQKRMIADLMASAPFKKVGGKKIPIARLSKISIGKLDRRHWVTYRVPVFTQIQVVASLYLTDEQIGIVKEKLGISTAVNALDITPEAIATGALVIE